LPTVNDERVAGDEGRFIRHEEQHAVSYFFRPTPAKQRLVGGYIVQAYARYQPVTSTNSDLNSAQASGKTAT